MIDWNKYFDHIYILSGCSNFEKREQLENEFKRVGLSNYNWWYNCDNYFIDDNKLGKLKDIHQKITFGHYSIIKTCYELGYENILILEDDIRFLKDINEIETQLNIFLENKDKCDCYYFDYVLQNNAIFNFDCVYINRRTMEYLIYCIENFGLCMDMNIPGYYLEENSFIYGWWYQINDISLYINIPLELLPINVKLSPIKLCIENHPKILEYNNIEYLSKYNIDDKLE